MAGLFWPFLNNIAASKKLIVDLGYMYQCFVVKVWTNLTSFQFNVWPLQAGNKLIVYDSYNLANSSSPIMQTESLS